jgi:hypothetical protein
VCSGGFNLKRPFLVVKTEKFVKKWAFCLFFPSFCIFLPYFGFFDYFIISAFLCVMPNAFGVFGRSRLGAPIARVAAALLP